MKTNSKDLDEIIFEGRFKEYGAYALRKSYSKNVTIALFTGVLFFLSVISVPLVAGWISNDVNIEQEDTVSITIVDLPEPQDIKPPEAPKQEVRSSPAFTPPVVTTDTTDLTDLALLIDKVPPRPVDTGRFEIKDDEKKDIIIEKDPVSVPFTWVEEMPEFPGGDAARIKYLSENTIYPLMARQTGIAGTVHVNFIVEKDGSISGVNILRGIGGGCDEESRRVVENMPRWKPGRQNGNEVRVSCNMPINFVLK